MSNTRTCSSCGFNATYVSEAMASHHHPRHSCAKHLCRTELAHRRADRARCAPKRSCQHPRARHVHGTRTAYVRDRCRCANCTAANTAASNQRHRERAYGRWKPYVDASPSRAHIAALRAAGIGVDQIAKVTGLSPGHLRGLIYPSGNGRPPFQKVRRETAERILAVRVDASSRAPNSRVDATGAAAGCKPSSRLAGPRTGWPANWTAHQPTSAAAWPVAQSPSGPSSSSMSCMRGSGTPSHHTYLPLSAEQVPRLEHTPQSTTGSPRLPGTISMMIRIKPWEL